MTDMINHPPHYTEHPSGVEVIEFTRLHCFSVGSAVKYIMRRDKKDDPLDNLNKACWFLKDAIDNGPPVRVTVHMGKVIRPVIDAEPNATVKQILAHLYLPEPGNSLERLMGGVPVNLDTVLDLVGALMEEYQTDDDEIEGLSL